MKINVDVLVGAALDWTVGLCFGLVNKSQPFIKSNKDYTFHPSTDWAQGGPIIEREKITISVDHSGLWLAWNGFNYADSKEHIQYGPTPLIAAMRCFVASKLGDEVEVPAGL
jgi:hypothetical protein